jgi:hypothetical protein
MQNLPIYLYPNTLDVILDLDETVLGINQVMYQRDLKIQKGIKNKIRIQFKNSDQKLLPISNTQTFVFNMFDNTSQELVLQKELTVLDDSIYLNVNANQGSISQVLTFDDVSNISVGQAVFGYGIAANSTILSIGTGSIATVVTTVTTSSITTSTVFSPITNIVTLNNYTLKPVSTSTGVVINTIGLKGLGELTFTESDTVNLERGEYTYSVVYQDPNDNTYLPVYANTYYGISGTVHLTEEVYPRLKPSQEIVSFLKSYNQDTYLYEHKSGPFYAYPEFKSNTALHTLAMYMTNYIGTVYIQATLSNNASDFGKYATVATLNYNGFNGIDYINFNGLFTYIRVMYIPGTAPASGNNDDPTYYGSFDKVLYRS